VRRILVVGASLAGIAAAEELRLQGFEGELLMIGAEERHPYDRPPLSKGLLTGALEPEACLLRRSEWEDELDVQLLLGSPATGLDLAARRVTLASGAQVLFDGLVIATGAEPVELPGRRLIGVHTLRTIDDALAIRARLTGGARLAVVGGGFIGSEVAASATRYGGSITVIEALSAPLARVLGTAIGGAIAQLHSAHGVNVRCGVPVSGLQGTERVEGVLLANGSIVEADVVVVGLGVRPCCEWLLGSGLALNDGVVCDAFCRTAVPIVVAAGDVARWAHPMLGSVRLEHWDNAVGQGQAAAISLLKPEGARPFAPVPYVWSDQYDRKLQLVGHPRPGDKAFVASGSLDDCEFLALYGREGQLTAGLGVNKPGLIRFLRELLDNRASLDTAITSLRERAGTALT
jgi:3-phenylpropionate/trans-cinnamate dioxygenase ferredoxin reductase subunit